MIKEKVRLIILMSFLVYPIVIVIFLIIIFSNKQEKHEWYINELNLNDMIGKIDDFKITIAYLDSGISDELMVKYKDRIISPYNVIDKTTNVKDKLGHGTKIISVVIGTKDKIGIVGISQKSKIMPIVIVKKMEKLYQKIW